MNTVQAIQNLLDRNDENIILHGKDGYLDCYMKKDAHSGAIIACDKDGNILTVFGLTEAKLKIQWEILRKSVDFMTAANSGKEIRPKGYGSFMTINYWLKNYRLSLGQVNGEWEIK